jgi:selenide,water dikinase
MGGQPITAMNVVCFPVSTLDISVLQDILKGGIDKMREAGVVLIGGHSIDDKELKYGLSVTGTIHPKKLRTNSGARVGDRLILTKPLGTGIVNTALKAGVAEESVVAHVTRCMAALNKQASEIMQEFDVNGCTDITGFGFIGHTSQLARNSNIGIVVYTASLPFFAEADKYARMGFCPGGLHRNREFYGNVVEIMPQVPEYIMDILFDPQTSGGLLIVVDEKTAGPLLQKLHKAGLGHSAIVGEVVSGPEGKLIIQ